MDLSIFVVSVFCIVDDWLKDKKVRQRGPKPTLHDSEVLTMEVVGEFLGMDEDKAIYTYFRRHWAAWFPSIAQVHRTTFVRQAANLWAIKQQLWEEVVSRIDHDPAISLVDSFPVPLCRFARASRCKLMPEAAAYGYDELARQTFYGFRAHVRVCWPGVITGVELTPANVHDLTALEHLTDGVTGWVIGDRNYWSPDRTEQLARRDITLLAPYKSAKREPFSWPRWLVHLRYRIETVFSQLVDRFNAKTVWARDSWHLTGRWWRKILAHTLAVFIAQQRGLASPLRFAELVTL
jgi:hypothetical protein